MKKILSLAMLLILATNLFAQNVDLKDLYTVRTPAETKRGEAVVAAFESFMENIDNEAKLVILLIVNANVEKGAYELKQMMDVENILAHVLDSPYLQVTRPIAGFPEIYWNQFPTLKKYNADREAAEQLRTQEDINREKLRKQYPLGR